MIYHTKIINYLGFNAVTVWPFIFIDPNHKNNIALIKHEYVHYYEQKRWFIVPWFLCYVLSKTFRFNAEVRGHAVQVKLGGGTLQWAAWHIATKYNTGRTIEQAEYALTQQLSKIS